MSYINLIFKFLSGRPRLYAKYILASVGFVGALALTQHLAVLGIPFRELHPTVFVIPVVVGGLFGALIATIRALHLRQAQYVRDIETQERRLREEIDRHNAAAAREARLQTALEEGASDGLWDWNIHTGEVYFSPRWCTMLGYDPARVPPRYDFWQDLLHPDDAPMVLDSLQRHLRGETSQFAMEYRIRDTDDAWRWVLGRGKLIERDADGRPARAVGTQTDITERKRMERALVNVMEGTAAKVGEAFFQGLARHLTQALEARFAIIGETPPAPAEERLFVTLAAWSPDGVDMDLSPIPLAGTPCARALASGQAEYLVDAGVQDAFPEAGMLRVLEAEGYMGAPIRDDRGEALGIIQVLDDKPLPEWKRTLARTVLPVFAARAGAELQRRRVERALTDEKVRAQVTLHSIGDAVITTDARGRVEFMNPPAERITGWSVDEVRGAPFEEVCDVFEEDTGEKVFGAMAQRGGFGREPDPEHALTLVNRQGERISIEHTTAPIRDGNGGVAGSVVILRDVTHTREMARHMSWQATHDALTGLINRKEFEHRLEELIERARGGVETHTLLYLDLDQFKVVNDTCGHSAGDEMLRQIASVLHHQVRSSDTLARLGGDEFGILLAGCPPSQANEIAEKLIAALRDFRFQWERKVFDVGVSIGLVQLDQEPDSLAATLSAADMACYTAKDLGRNRIHVYHPDDAALANRHGEMQWLTRIKDALARERLVLYHQTIFHLRDASLCMHEMMVRMLDDDGTVIAPGAFIPAAERYGVMPEIDRWVIENTFRDACRAAGNANLCCINLSGTTLTEESALDFIRDAARRHRVNPAGVCFEITETAAISNLARAVRFMEVLKADGFMFSLDDFGSGLSSFGYLKNLPVDFLKIDGSFVRDMVRDPIDESMVHAINEIGHTMDILTIAEFVEDEDTLVALRGIGVDYAQGFHLHRPEPLVPLGAGGER